MLKNKNNKIQQTEINKTYKNYVKPCSKDNIFIHYSGKEILAAVI